MNFKDVIKLSRERVIILDDNEYGIELVAFDRMITNWSWANKKAIVLDICGYTGWKIPTIKELESIVNQCSFEEISSMFEENPKSFCSYDGEKLNLLWSSDIYRENAGGGRKEIFIYDYKKLQRCVTIDNYNINCCYIRYADK